MGEIIEIKKKSLEERVDWILNEMLLIKSRIVRLENKLTLLKEAQPETSGNIFTGFLSTLLSNPDIVDLSKNFVKTELEKRTLENKKKKMKGGTHGK